MEQNNQSIGPDGLKPRKTLRENIIGWGKVGLVVGAIIWMMVAMSKNRNHTPMSAGGKEHICTYCGNSYKGAGYYHQMDDCQQSSSDPGYDQCCSRKCCSEDWAKNGSGKFH